MSKLLALLAAMLLCAGAGCEKKSAEPVEESRFDPALDGPPSRLEKPINEDIVKDQRQVARQAGRAVAAVSTPPPAPSPPTPTGGPVDQVKQTVASMIATVRPGQEERILDFLEPQDASTLRPMIQGIKQLTPKMQQFEKLVQDKLGMPLPADIKGTSSASMPGIPLDLSKAKLGDFTFAQQGQEVLVKGPRGEDWRFAKAGQQWKIKLPAGIAKVVPVVSELFTAFGNLLAEMTAGINDGAITKDNFQAKSDELGKKHLEAVTNKLFGLIFQEMMPTTMPAPGDSSL